MRVVGRRRVAALEQPGQQEREIVRLHAHARGGAAQDETARPLA